MTQHLEQLLEKCLDKAACTDDIEPLLRHHPQEADQLRPLLQTAIVARRHYNATPPPPPGKLATGRARVLAEAGKHKKQIAAISVRPGKPAVRRRLALKFAAALMASMIILASIGTGVALAAQDSLPGDALYQTKLTVEDWRLSLTSNRAAKTELALQLGEERVQEIKALAESEQPIPEQVVTRMQNLFGQALQEASQAPPEKAATLMEQIANRTKTQARILEQLQAKGKGDQFTLKKAQQLCLQTHTAAKTRMGNPADAPGKPGTIESTGEPIQEQEQKQNGQGEGQGEKSGPGEGSGEKSGPSEGSGEKSGPGEGSGEKSGPSEGSGEKSGPGEGSGEKPGPGEGSGEKPGQEQEQNQEQEQEQNQEEGEKPEDPGGKGAGTPKSKESD
jgi:hypothetical protein